MFFQLKETVAPVELQNIDENILTLGIITLEELEQCYEQFGFSPVTVNECKDDAQQIHTTIDVYENYHFGIIVGIDTKHIIKIQDRIALYIKENLFLIVIMEDKDDSIRAKLFESLDHINLNKVSLERLIYGFLERIIIDDYTALEKIETEISDYEDTINNNQISKSFINDLTKIRKKLLLLDNYYDQLTIIGEELAENEADIFNEKNLRYFKMFTDKVSRLINNTRMLQEFSIHVKEAYHAQLDNNLNNIMKIFTVVTTIFLPLTLIVGWYGMNFTNMPELSWKFGYLYVIILSIIVIIFSIIFFKRKKFM